MIRHRVLFVLVFTFLDLIVTAADVHLSSVLLKHESKDNANSRETVIDREQNTRFKVFVDPATVENEITKAENILDQGCSENLVPLEIEDSEFDNTEEYEKPADDSNKIENACDGLELCPLNFTQERIIGGGPAPKGKFSWMVLLMIRRIDEPLCGGVLITVGHVLTAAHCLSSNTSKIFIKEKLYVRIGDYNLADYEGTEANHDIRRIHLHPAFNRTKYLHDIAIVELKHRVKDSRLVEGLFLPGRKRKLPVGDAFILGWGQTSFVGPLSSILLAGKLEVWPDILCSLALQHLYFPEAMLCAGTEFGGVDTCGGDSGGPLITRDTLRNMWVLDGINSWGISQVPCGTKLAPGGYTRVSTHMNWLVSVVKNKPPIGK